MIAAQFIFEPGDYDDEFHTLDESIDRDARALPGFIGIDKWVSEDGTRINVIYYFADMSAVTKLGRIEDHRDAKKKVDRWYKGYRVVVSEVTATYGNMPHLAAPID